MKRAAHKLFGRERRDAAKLPAQHTHALHGNAKQLHSHLRMQLAQTTHRGDGYEIHRRGKCCDQRLGSLVSVLFERGAQKEIVLADEIGGDVAAATVPHYAQEASCHAVEMIRPFIDGEYGFISSVGAKLGGLDQCGAVSL
ncbi:hypothetical protein D9M72_586300 [compost metagenome]